MVTRTDSAMATWLAPHGAGGVFCVLMLAVLAGLPASARPAAAGESGIPETCLNAAQAERVQARAEPGEPHVWRTATGGLLRQAELVPLPADSPADADTGVVDVRFVALGEEADRWERRPGHVMLSPGDRWLARELVRQGRAIVAPRLAAADCLAHLLKEETRARQRKAGLWAQERVWSAHDPEALSERTGRYTLVAGRVISVGETRSMVYLNFGGRWSRDFTATISAERKAAFVDAGLDVTSLDGAAIRLRGMVRQAGGPSIELVHPAQIERLDRNGDQR
ncbi:thermonuclease family protein [Stappia indica]|uniref:thermonuclease family protein n=1 Tax=Stappia indica TaxID=538381 RepID=UPI0011119429|nr:thermonuclease family protein [Stappia indica]